MLDVYIVCTIIKNEVQIYDYLDINVPLVYVEKRLQVIVIWVRNKNSKYCWNN